MNTQTGKNHTKLQGSKGNKAQASQNDLKVSSAQPINTPINKSKQPHVGPAPNMAIGKLGNLSKVIISDRPDIGTYSSVKQN